ncbi:DUF5776 domain-containing protein [Secundilactobacillus paracollinoides]|nr:DUF5776 domain-containing protein [Secundilactobacillus paracollinoides]
MMKHKTATIRIAGKVGLVTLVSASILGAGELGSTQLGHKLGLNNTSLTKPTVAKADSNNTFTYDGQSITVTSISEGGTVTPSSTVGSDGTLNYVMSVPIGHTIQASDFISAQGTVGDSTDAQALTADQINAAVAAGVIDVRYNQSTNMGYEGAAVSGWVYFNGAEYMLFSYSASATVPGNAQTYTDSQGIIYKVFTGDSGDNIAYISGGTAAAKKGTSLSIPATVDYNGTTYKVTSILSKAFAVAKPITTLDMSQATNLLSIGQGAFMQTQIGQVILPDSVVSLGANVFMNTSSNTQFMTKFDGGTVLTIMGQMALADNALNDITLPADVTYGSSALGSQSPTKTASTTPTTGQALITSTTGGLQLPLSQLITLNVGGESQVNQIAVSGIKGTGVTYNQTTQTFTVDPSVTSFSFGFGNFFGSSLPGGYGGTYTVTVNNGADTVTPQDQTIDPGATLPDAASYISSITDANGNSVDPATAASDGSLKITYPDGTPDTNTPGTYEVDITYNDGTNTYSAVAHLTVSAPADSSSSSSDSSSDSSSSSDSNSSSDGNSSSDSNSSSNGNTPTGTGSSSNNNGGTGNNGTTGNGGTDTGSSSANNVSSSSSSSSSTTGTATGTDTETTTSANTASIGEKVYAKKALNLYSKPTFSTKNRVTGYAKKTRIYAPIFTINGTAKSANGVLRYKVTTESGKKGYITANDSYTAPLYWQGGYSKLYVINPAGTYAYKTQTFNKSHRATLLKQGTAVKVTKVIKSGLTTRYQLTNGTYISGNKQWTSPTKPTFPAKVANRGALNLYSDKNLTHKIKHYSTKHVFTVQKWDYSNGRAQHKGNALRYKVAGGYISGNSALVKAVK